MMWIKSFIREISSMLLSSKVQCRAKSIKNYSTGYNKTVNMNKKLRTIKDIPGPKALPLLGNWFRFMPYIGEYHNVSVMTLLRMLRDKYGDIVKLDGLIKQRPRIWLFSPKLCKDMYQVQGKWPIRYSLEPLNYYRQNRDYIYNGQYGLGASQGQSWADLRSKVNPHMMRIETVNMHITQLYEVINEFVDKMRALRDPNTLELPSDFMNELNKWSLESKCTVALNCQLGCLKPNLAEDSEPQVMINCLKEAFDLMYRLETLPSLWEVYNTQNLKKLFHVLDIISKISGKHIQYAKTQFLKTIGNTNIENRSLLEKFLYIDYHIAYIMAIDTLISTDTTSNAAGALLYHIANNMEKQKKLREEVKSVLPDKTTPITTDMLKNIPYARACIKESMRLFPIVSGIQRTMPIDVSIGGYMIPKETEVIACHALLSLDPTYFPRPNEYIPERWIRSSPEFSLYKKLHPFVYMPFGYGARSCAGQRFAELELEMLLLKVIRNFRIEWHYGPLEYKSQLINTVLTPLKLKLIDL